MQGAPRSSEVTLSTCSEMPLHPKIELKFGNVVFEERGIENRSLGEKPLGAELRTNNKLDLNMTRVRPAPLCCTPRCYLL